MEVHDRELQKKRQVPKNLPEEDAAKSFYWPVLKGFPGFEGAFEGFEGDFGNFDGVLGFLFGKEGLFLLGIDYLLISLLVVPEEGEKAALLYLLLYCIWIFGN